MIKFKLLDDGGFVCGDTVTGFTAYAYPTSVAATKAKRHPDTVAQSMMTVENAHPADLGIQIDYDVRNWERLFDCFAPEARPSWVDAHPTYVAAGPDEETV